MDPSPLENLNPLSPNPFCLSGNRPHEIGNSPKEKERERERERKEEEERGGASSLGFAGQAEEQEEEEANRGCLFPTSPQKLDFFACFWRWA